jgi:hypothetical protein
MGDGDIFVAPYLWLILAENGGRGGRGDKGGVMVRGGGATQVTGFCILSYEANNLLLLAWLNGFVIYLPKEQFQEFITCCFVPDSINKHT